jgi:LmbE family N-acetylglucosaminyl deacetylase
VVDLRGQFWYNSFMHWIYLSPHLDDVVLSAGGLVWEQIAAGETVEIWTVCAGDPPALPFTPFAQELHTRWGMDGAQTSAVRRMEDQAACRVLGAEIRHSPVPDCIYRRVPESGEAVIRDRDDLFRAYSPSEEYLVADIAAWIRKSLPEGARLVSPLALGGHVDHRLVQDAAQSLLTPLWFYADYPYVIDDPLNHSDLRAQVAGYQPSFVQGISPPALAAWQAAVAAYTSQISTFWGSLEEMRARIAAYHQEGGGAVLWQIWQK